MFPTWFQRTTEPPHEPRSRAARRVRETRSIRSAAIRLEELESRYLLSSFVVNSSDDNDDGSCNQSHCSLREAIIAANAESGADVITFDISGNAVPIIKLDSQLPKITDPLTIDGTTQQAGRVAVDGSDTKTDDVPSPYGFSISGGSSTVRGMVIYGFGGFAITASGPGGNAFEDNWIGLDVTGHSVGGNSEQSDQPHFGNYAAIWIDNSDGNRIGGESPHMGNVISGNLLGVVLFGGTNTLVAGNLIGTDVTGTEPLGNYSTALWVAGSHNTIGGTTAAARNVVSATTYHGISIGGDDNIVQGNFVGTDVTGLQSFGNATGIEIGYGHNNLIGGTTPGAGNLVSGNREAGISNSAGTSSVVQGNLVGTDPTGTFSIANEYGIDLFDTADVTIGGTSSAAANVISGNFAAGLRIRYSSRSGNNIIGNSIGTDRTGVRDIGNVGSGILIESSSGVSIGGLEPAQANVIAFNRQNGITVDPRFDKSVANKLLGNSIFANFGLGIDLGDDLVTPNDSDDGDDGANRLQNFPTIAEVVRNAASTEIKGSLSSAPNTTYRIEFFADSSCDPTGLAEAARYLGSTEITTDANGNATLDVTLSAIVGSDSAVTATATDPDGNTSELSPVAVDECLLEAPAIFVNSTGDQSDADPADAVCDVDPNLSGTQCTLRAALETANRSPGRDPINFEIPGTGIPTIRPKTELPTITGPVTIDGTTQPGGQVELDGTDASQLIGDSDNTVSGLRLRGGRSVLRGMIINGFSGAGILLKTGGYNVFERNWIGPDVTGNASGGSYSDRWGNHYHGNGAGIGIEDSRGNTIGGDSFEDRNVISGNQGSGIGMVRSDWNQILENFIGVNATGVSALPNHNGIWMWESDGNTIGGTTPPARNLISGNRYDGMAVGGQQNIVQGNFVGTDVSGTQAIENGGNGILVGSGTGNVIGGTAPGAGNLVSGNHDTGIGVHFDANTPDPATLIQGNLIGTDITGTVPIGNGDGIDVGQSPHTTIGGTVAGASNVISGNRRYGIWIRDDYQRTGQAVVVGNFVGTDRTGVLAIGNASDGILIFDSSQNTIGGTAAGEANVIAFNGNNGIGVGEQYNSAVANYISANALFGNAGLGIDLGDDGVTTNDPNDADTGPNKLQNSPVLLIALASDHLSIRGTLNSTPGKQFGIQFFVNETDTLAREGERFIGAIDVATGDSGNSIFVVHLPVHISFASSVTAVATDSTGNTSEFSAPIPVRSYSVWPDRPPTAEAGGPYETTELKSTTLDARASSDPDEPSETLNYEWDFDGDQIFGETGTAAARGDEVGDRPVFVAAGLLGPTSVTVALRVADVEGLTAEDTAIISIRPNLPPTADAGGPYDVVKNSSITLDASHSSDPDQSTESLIFEWDLDSDGVFGEVGSSASRGNETGMHPVFSATGLIDVTIPAILRVTDDVGHTVEQSLEIVVLPNRPPVANPGGPYQTYQGLRIALDASGSSDPDQPSDSLTYLWDLDGDGIFGETEPAALRGEERGTHVVMATTPLPKKARQPISLRVIDDLGVAVTNPVDVVIKPGPNALVIDHVLTVVGSTGSDVIAIGHSTDNTDFEVNLNGVVFRFPVADATTLLVVAGSGNDSVRVAPDVQIAGTIVGGLGNDSLVSGSGDDTVFGGDGNDLLDGGPGNDTVKGELGNDTLLASRGYDVLDLGAGSNSFRLGALAASLQTIWVQMRLDSIRRNGHTKVDMDFVLDINNIGLGDLYVNSQSLSSTCESSTGVQGHGPLHEDFAFEMTLTGDVTDTCTRRGVRSTKTASINGNLTGQIFLETGTITTSRETEAVPAGSAHGVRSRVRTRDAIANISTIIPE